MKFCDAPCEMVMALSVAGGELVFSCPGCGATKPADPADHRITGEQLMGRDTSQKYATMIRGAGHDPVNAKVDQPCPKCRMVFVTKVMMPVTEQVIYTCSCGYVLMT